MKKRAASYLLASALLVVLPLLVAGVGTGPNICYPPDCEAMAKGIYDTNGDGICDASAAIDSDGDGNAELAAVANVGFVFNANDDATGLPTIADSEGMISDGTGGSKLGLFLTTGPIGTTGTQTILHYSYASCISNAGAGGGSLYADKNCNEVLDDGENYINDRHHCVRLHDDSGRTGGNEFADGTTLWMHQRAVKITGGWCYCQKSDTCTATATLYFEQDDGTNMGQLITCDGGLDGVSTGNALDAMERMGIDIQTAGDDDGDDYVVCWTWSQDN